MTQTISRTAVSMRVIPHATCVECGCLCDDIELTVDQTRIVEAKNACELGQKWFLQSLEPQAARTCRVRGEPVDLDTAVAEAARLLHEAAFPLVYGLTESTCEGQRMGVALADRIGACLDTATSIHHGPSGVSFPDIGEVTCSLGEVKNRADLVIFWGVDPIASHPRHAERYSLDARGLFIPEGRKDRYAVHVDARPSAAPEQYDCSLIIPPGKDFEVLWALRALVKGVPVGSDFEKQTGVALADLIDLAGRMKACHFGVLFIGMGLSRSAGRHMNNEAALGLVTDLNDHTRFFAKTMKVKGNGTGADNVLLWQTGYPFAVHLGQGYPRYNPGEFSAVESLERSEPDAALIVGADPRTEFPVKAAAHLLAIPTIALDFRDTETMRRATVSIPTAAYGLQTGGTVYRMDDVSLPLRPALPSIHPSQAEVLGKIDQAVHRLQAAQAPAIG